MSLELGDLPYPNGKIIENHLGVPGLAKLGKRKWKREVLYGVDQLKCAFIAEEVLVNCQLGLREGKMKGSTKPERMDEPFSFKPEDRSHRSCVLHELGGNARRCQSSGGANH